MLYKPGDILLEKYHIEESIGRGAFAEIYRVTHTKLKVTRAVKILDRETPGVGSTEFKEFLARFQLEAQLGANLNTPTPHPNLLQVHDFQQSGELLLLEMEHASGGNLADRIARARDSGESIPIEEIIQIAQDIAGGLARIHDHDIVHRDLKPSNILFDHKGVAKVADLGLAQIPGGPSMRSRMSEAIPHPGTPGYMSPEQKDQRDYLSPNSDLYALGLILFEMITGRFYRNLRPGTHAKDLRSDVPPWLDEIITKLLSKNSQDRPWNGAEVVQLIKAQGMLKEEPLKVVNEIQPKDEERKKFNLREIPTWMVFASIIILFLCIGYVAVSISQNNRTSLEQEATVILPTDTRSLMTETFNPAVTIEKDTAFAEKTLTPTIIDSTNTPVITSTPSPIPLAANITYPQNGTSVGWEVEVRGKITGLESGFRAFMCIQSTAFEEPTWPQGEIFPDSSGNWMVKGYYQSPGYDYRTFVVVTNNNASAEMLADQYYRASGMSELPDDTTIISPIITVTRE